MPVEGEGRIRLVRLQDLLDRLMRRGQFGQGTFRKGLGKARRRQQGIAVAQGHLETLRQPHDHLAAWLRPSGFEEAQMPRRAVSRDGQVHLRHPPTLAPAPQQHPEWKR